MTKAGRVSTEQDAPDADSVAAFRIAGERACLAFANRGVRAGVVVALEKAPAGSVLHGVGESAVTIRSIAERIARSLDIPVASLTLDQAAEHIGNPFLATLFSLDAPVSSDHTQALLGWAPEHPTLLEDLETGDYFVPQASTRAEKIWLRHG